MDHKFLVYYIIFLIIKLNFKIRNFDIKRIFKFK